MQLCEFHRAARVRAVQLLRLQSGQPPCPGSDGLLRVTDAAVMLSSSIRHFSRDTFPPAEIPKRIQ